MLQPDTSSSQLPTLFSKMNFNIILPSIPVSSKILCAFFMSPMRTIYPAHLFLLDLITLITFGEDLHPRLPPFPLSYVPNILITLRPCTLSLCSYFDVGGQVSRRNCYPENKSMKHHIRHNTLGM